MRGVRPASRYQCGRVARIVRSVPNSNSGRSHHNTAPPSPPQRRGRAHAPVRTSVRVGLAFTRGNRGHATSVVRRTHRAGCGRAHHGTPRRLSPGHHAHPSRLRSSGNFPRPLAGGRPTSSRDGAGTVASGRGLHSGRGAHAGGRALPRHPAVTAHETPVTARHARAAPHWGRLRAAGGWEATCFCGMRISLCGDTSDHRRPCAGPRSPRFGSFGCSVNLPLGSRSADPHSTAVGVEACSTPVLNRAQRGCVPLFTRWSTRYYNQDLRRETLEEGKRGRPRPARRSRVPFLHGDALLPACVTATSPHHSAGGSSEGMSALAWAPSIFGAARFGR